MTTRPLPRLLAVALLGAIAALLLVSAPAGAHGGDGTMEITSVTREGGDVTVAARLVYVEDGHGVPDATVTVVVDDGTPVPMTAGAAEGDYTATVAAAPGAAIRVTSVEPPVGAETTAPDEEATSTAPATTTTAPPTTANEEPTEPTTTTAPTEAETAAPQTDAAASTGDEDDGGINVVLIGAAVAIVAGAGVMAAIFLGKKPDGSTDVDGEDPRG